MDKERKIKDWIIATRPWSFPASTMPALVTIFIFIFENRIPAEINWWYEYWHSLVLHFSGKRKSN